jgi:hypothetical protein
VARDLSRDGCFCNPFRRKGFAGVARSGTHKIQTIAHNEKKNEKGN